MGAAVYRELLKQHKSNQDKINQQEAREQKEAATKIQMAMRLHKARKAVSEIKTAQQTAKQNKQEEYETTVALIEAQKAAEYTARIAPRASIKNDICRRRVYLPN